MEHVSNLDIEFQDLVLTGRELNSKIPWNTILFCEGNKSWEHKQIIASVR